jgi:maltooligosyltrehalose synthase
VIVVPRLMKHLLDDGFTWSCTRLELPSDAPRYYRNIFTDDKLSANKVDDHLELNIRELFGAFPVALLVSSTGSATPNTVGN